MRTRTTIDLAVIVGWLVTGCGQAPVSDVEQDVTCATQATVAGIDVSVYQGTIDWTSVKSAGVVFAFIRVSDGMNSLDSKFAANWAGSRSAGVIHGAYQFFRPSQDPIVQADLLLSKMGSLAADDLPPVIDVEATDGLSPAAVTTAVEAWVAHVTSAIGRPPIIYTGFYFWRDMVGGPDLTSSPLWHAQYTTASCPTIAAPWTDWTIWQYSLTGTVGTISGNVDLDRWNGDLASLQAFLGPMGTCGTIAALGGMVDDGDPCFQGGGPSAYLRHAADAGINGGLTWTHTTSAATEANFGQWNLSFEAAGHYHVEAYTAAAYAQSKQASYHVHTAAGDHDQLLDQTAADGWQALGDYDFAAGGQQDIHLADNTGEPGADNIQLVFDAIRFTNLDTNVGSGSGSGSGASSGSGDGSGSDGSGMQHGSCATGNGVGLGLTLAVVGLRRRRRPR